MIQKFNTSDKSVNEYNWYKNEGIQILQEYWVQIIQKEISINDTTTNEYKCKSKRG